FSMKVIQTSESCDTATNGIRFVRPFLRQKVQASNVLNNTHVTAPFYLAHDDK
ncbi:hypothetical protein ACJMK2_037822, partial [Sinanodonta woodiana]